VIAEGRQYFVLHPELGRLAEIRAVRALCK